MLLFPEDCGQLVICCGQVLPQALVALDPHHAPCCSEQVSAAVQSLDAALRALLPALQQLTVHEGLGVVSILCESPDVWLGLYRAIRGLTAQLSTILACLRLTAPRSGHANADAFELLQKAIVAFTAICQRSRDAARLFGEEMLSVAQVAAAWEPGRLHAALEACTAAPQQRQPAAACAAAAPAPAGRTSGGGGAWPWLRPGSAGRAAPGSDNGDGSPQQQQPSEASLVSIVARVQQLFLFDSEMDQLEQDRAYLLDRLATLRAAAHRPAGARWPAAPQQPAGGQAGVAGGCDGGSAADGAMQIVLAELLLAAVNARIGAVAAEEASGVGGAGYDSTVHSFAGAAAGSAGTTTKPGSSPADVATAAAAGPKWLLAPTSEAEPAAAVAAPALATLPAADAALPRAMRHSSSRGYESSSGDEEECAAAVAALKAGHSGPRPQSRGLLACMPWAGRRQ